MINGKKFLAWLLVAGGLLLLISGSREFIESWWAQKELAEDIEQPAPPVLPPPKQAPEAQPPETPKLRRGELFARLSIPRLNKEWSVLEGVGKKELRRGPGHMIGTAFPGQADNMIIAGHRDTHFRVLKDIRAGDEIVLTFQGKKVIYRVSDTEIIMPTTTRVLQPTPEPKLTLITCYPFYYVGSAPKRFIVHAELAEPAPLQTASKAAKSPAITP